ncbi:MAG TPA: helix-turn-helix transcriptional regulator [Acidimicrobiales bacterium]|nr:helix-turn-helix transcriptional regulator [Acidimicrobiales bacterium]
MTPSLIREARERAGLTQAELAARSGVAQSTISAYESGKREPGVEALERLLDAAGYELTIRRRMPTPEQAGRQLYEVLELADTIRRAKRGMPRPRASLGAR